MVLKSNEVVNKTFDSSMFGGFKKEEVTSYMHLVANTLSNYEKLVTEYAQGDYKKKAQILDSNKEFGKNKQISPYTSIFHYN